MSKYFIREQANIDVCPAVMPSPDTTVSDICIGDLHGNALKLVYFLVRQGIARLTATHYARLVAIYKIPQLDLTLALLMEYQELVHSMEIMNRNTLIRLIGDELSDRGANDYYVLEILHKLHQEKVNVHILLSNHGAEFIEAYERFDERNHQFTVTSLGHFAASLTALNTLVQRNLLDAQYIFDRISDSYQPALKLLDCSLDPLSNSITIYSHAGIGIQSLRPLAKRFNVIYEDNTRCELAATIEKINNAFHRFVDSNRVHQLCRDQSRKEGNPVEFIIWNRSYGGLDRSQKYHGYSLSFVHGHDANDKTQANIFNLDNYLGKSPELHTCEYTVLLSNEIPNR